MKLLTVTVAALFLLVACQTSFTPDLPTGPDTTQQQTMVVPETTSTSNPTVQPTDEFPYGGYWISIGNGKVKANLFNESDDYQYLGLACYAGPHQDPNNQVIPSYPSREAYYKIIKVKGGENADFTVLEPCGKYQCDAFYGLRKPKEPPWYGENLLFGEVGTGEKNCKPTCDDCTPPPCEKTELPEGRYECSDTPTLAVLPCCTWLQKECRWDCPNVCVDASLTVDTDINDDTLCLIMNGSHTYALTANQSAPLWYQPGQNMFCWQVDCEETLNWSVSLYDDGWFCTGDSGTFEGPCPPCEPTGEPDCPEQTWDTNLCAWVGDCICEPVGNPECPEQEWDTNLCEWVGECVCEPTGQPECPEQVWDPVLCQWDGECSQCPTIEPDANGRIWYCHVSSKVNGGINEQQMSGGQVPPGHCMHFDPTKWCPPDYAGRCDGRSFSYQCPQ